MQQFGYRWPETDLEGAAAYARENLEREDGRNVLWNVIQQFGQKNLPAGIAWAATLPASPQQQAYWSYFNTAYQQRNLPAVFAEVEQLPIAQQETVARTIARGIVNSHSGNAEVDARLLSSLKQLPASLRNAARGAIEATDTVPAGRKEAALEVLK